MTEVISTVKGEFRVSDQLSIEQTYDTQLQEGLTLWSATTPTASETISWKGSVHEAIIQTIPAHILLPSTVAHEVGCQHQSFRHTTATAKFSHNPPKGKGLKFGFKQHRH